MDFILLTIRSHKIDWQVQICILGRWFLQECFNQSEGEEMENYDLHMIDDLDLNCGRERQDSRKEWVLIHVCYCWPVLLHILENQVMAWFSWREKIKDGGWFEEWRVCCCLLLYGPRVHKRELPTSPTCNGVEAICFVFKRVTRCLAITPNLDCPP